MNFKNKTKQDKYIEERLKWETDEEYNYRIEISKLLGIVSTHLKNIGNMSKDSRNLEVQKNLFQTLNNNLKKIKVPNRYIKVSEYIYNQFDCYLEAMKLIERGMNENNPQLTRKGGLKIEEATLWLNIIKLKMWEAVEDEILNNSKN